jgi:hypothetical protein
MSGSKIGQMGDVSNMTGDRHLLERLEREGEQLRALAVLVDSHAQEFVVTMQRKRSHLANIAGLAPGVALVRQCYEEMNELYCGAEYRKVMSHVEDYRAALINRRQSLAVEIEELRHQLVAAEPLRDGSTAVGI